MSKITEWESCPMEVENCDAIGTVYVFIVEGKENYAYVYKSADFNKDFIPTIRFQSQCIMGIILGDTECDCRQNLVYSQQYLAQLPNGGILFILNDDGKNQSGIIKLKQKKLRMEGMCMPDILNIPVGVWDARTYKWIPEAMKIIGIPPICKTITRHPRKVKDLIKDGVEITDAIGYDYNITSGNQTYMDMKKNCFNFQFS